MIVKYIYNELTRPMPLENNFENYDEYWESRGFNKPVFLKRAKLISKLIKPNSSILDIGCGDGTIIDYLNKNCNTKKVIGIDISEKAVQHVKKLGHDAFQFDILSPAFSNFLKDKKFDYIIITELLEHLNEPEKLIVKIKEHFSDSIFISIPNSGFFIHRLRLLFGKFPIVMIQQNIKEHIRFWTLSDFKYWTMYFGLKIDKLTISSGFFPNSLSYLNTIFPSLLGRQIIFKIKIK